MKLMMKMMMIFADLSIASDIMSGMRDVGPMMCWWPLVTTDTDHLCAHWSEALVSRELASSSGQSNASNCPINVLIIPMLPTLMVIINLTTWPSACLSNWGVHALFIRVWAITHVTWLYSGNIPPTEQWALWSRYSPGLMPTLTLAPRVPRTLSADYHVWGRRKQKS